MKATISKTGNAKKYSIEFKSGIWPIISACIVIFALGTIFILNVIYFIPKFFIHEASHVTYYCTHPKKHSIISKSAVIYPAIGDVAQVDSAERDLELKTGCPYVAIYAVQTMPCRDCGKDRELARKDKEIDGLNKELMQSRGGRK